MLKVASVITMLIMSWLSHAKHENSGQCDTDKLLMLKQNNFVISADEKRNSTALSLLSCLDHPNPEIRDGVVYEANSKWVRAELLSSTTLTSMFNELTQILTDKTIGSHKKTGFAQPFAALVLSEVVRADRVNPYLTDEQRQKAVDVSAGYMKSITDYRGFNEQDGWRHAVAHTADIFLQLALNKQIRKPQLEQMLTAIKHQVAPTSGHFYTFGEPKRLSMPFVYIVLRAQFSESELADYLQSIANPSPFKSWNDVYKTESGLAKLHNIRSFIYSVFVITANSENPELKRIQPSLKKLINQLS